MRLPKEYMEKIASNWSRMKFKTAKEAMDFVQEQQKPKAKPRKTYQSKKQSNEIIPEWFEESKKQRKEPTKEKSSLTEEQKHEQEELIALLQRHASKNN